MNPEELKSAWQTVRPSLSTAAHTDMTEAAMLRRKDVKSKILGRFLLDIAITAICICLLATSHLWAPMKFPYWWIILFCGAAAIETVVSIRMYAILKKTDLGKSTNTEIMNAVIKIRRCYKNMELAIFITMMPLLIWVSFTPAFIGSWRMYFVWILTIIAFGFEYVWYSSNMRQLKQLNIQDSDL